MQTVTWPTILWAALPRLGGVCTAWCWRHSCKADPASDPQDFGGRGVCEGLDTDSLRPGLLGLRDNHAKPATCTSLAMSWLLAVVIWAYHSHCTLLARASEQTHRLSLQPHLSLSWKSTYSGQRERATQNLEISPDFLFT